MSEILRALPWTRATNRRVIELHDDATPIELAIYGSKASDSDYERASILMDADGLTIDVQKGSAGGTQRPLVLKVGGTTALSVSTAGVVNVASMDARSLGSVAPFWTTHVISNADIVALGAVTAGEITVVSSGARAILHRALIEVVAAATGATTITASLGTAAAAYDQLLLAADIMAAAGTLYGDLAAELGTAFVDYLGVFYPTTTALKVQVAVTGGGKTMANVTGASLKIHLLRSNLG